MNQGKLETLNQKAKIKSNTPSQTSNQLKIVHEKLKQDKGHLKPYTKKFKLKKPSVKNFETPRLHQGVQFVGVLVRIHMPSPTLASPSQISLTM